MSPRRLLSIAALLSGLLVFGCGILQGMKQAVRKELYETSADAGSAEAEFFFELDPDWKRQHTQYQGDYGIIYYEDRNGNESLDYPDEMVRISPKGYPSDLIDSEKPYTPDADDRPARLR